ncbi:MAG: cobalamin-binding protein [Planctomycetota bacterium]
MNIVSLLPSATEIICELGLRSQLVGVTHECDYPPSVEHLPKVTQSLIPVDATSREIDGLVRDRLQNSQALYSLDHSVLERVCPDVIVTQSLCDVCAVAEDEVRAAASSLPSKPQVIDLAPTRLVDVLDCMRRVGEVAGEQAPAQHVITGLEARLDAVQRRTDKIATEHRPNALLLEWIDPPFSAGHWSPELVERAGGVEAIGVAGHRSESVSWNRILEADPDVLVIACCGFSVRRTCEDLPILLSYPGWDSLSCAKTERVYVVDGSAYFSRPGPRLVDSLEILAHALHPDHHPLPAGLPAAIQLDAISRL